jgi:hypothetical protein
MNVKPLGNRERNEKAELAAWPQMKRARCESVHASGETRKTKNQVQLGVKMTCATHASVQKQAGGG